VRVVGVSRQTEGDEGQTLTTLGCSKLQRNHATGPLVRDSLGREFCKDWALVVHQLPKQEHKEPAPATSDAERWDVGMGDETTWEQGTVGHEDVWGDPRDLHSMDLSSTPPPSGFTKRKRAFLRRLSLGLFIDPYVEPWHGSNPAGHGGEGGGGGQGGEGGVGAQWEDQDTTPFLNDVYVNNAEETASDLRDPWGRDDVVCNEPETSNVAVAEEERRPPVEEGVDAGAWSVGLRLPLVVDPCRDEVLEVLGTLSAAEHITDKREDMHRRDKEQSRDVIRQQLKRGDNAEESDHVDRS